MWCGEVPAWPGELRDMASSVVPDGDATAAVLAVPEDLALYIASFLGGETLARLEATSKACGSLYANEAAWEACVRARWHDPRWLDVPMDCYRAATNEVLDSLRRARRGARSARPSEAMRRVLLVVRLPRAAPPQRAAAVLAHAAPRQGGGARALKAPAPRG